jgi:hypothetical protein
MAETEVNGQSGKQAYTLAGGETPRAYMRVDVRRLLETLAGEDVVNDVMKVEQRYAYSLVAANAAVKSAPGFLHSLTFSCNDAAPTAGTIDVYDNTAASGTKIFSWTLPATAFAPCSVIIDAVFATGLYVAFTTTADVNVTVSYR